MQQRNFVESFNCAIEGLIYVLRTQKNMRVHFLLAMLVLLFGIYLNLTGIEILILCCAIAFVLLAEMLNTALESTIDLISGSFHPIARIVKDITAGATLIAAINSVVVGYIIFSRHLSLPIDTTILRIKQSSWHLTFIALLVVVAAVIAGKVLLHRGTPLRGGMPSGHAALAFSFWTIIAFTSKSALVVLLSLIMASLVALSRVREAIHSVWEVMAGAALGALLTVLIFQVLR